MNQQNRIEPELVPWYRVGMVWLMIGLPAFVVVASLFTVVIAHQNAPELTVKISKKES